jgi:hypothetical protein
MLLLVHNLGRSTGRRYNLDYVRDQYFTTWRDANTKGGSRRADSGTPRKFAIKFRKVENTSRPVIVASGFLDQ